MATMKSPWTGTDVYLKYISAENGKLNGLGGRCIKYYPDKGRYSVRLHYTGRVLLVKEECLVSSKSQERMRVVPLKGGKRGTITIDSPVSLNALDHHSDEKAEKRFMGVDEERFDAAIGLIRKNADYRFALSERVRTGILEKKEAGALVVNLMKVDETRPIFVENAHDLIMDERQTVFMTNTEMKKKFGKAYTHGRQLLRNLYEPGLYWITGTAKCTNIIIVLLPRCTLSRVSFNIIFYPVKFSIIKCGFMFCWMLCFVLNHNS